MEKRLNSTIAILGLTILFVSVPILSINTQIEASNSDSITSISTVQDTIDMLIFISPQYSADIEIKSSIDHYINVVKDDINWNTKIITIKPNQNNFKKIDQIIEQHHIQHKLKACIMVGEDIDTALAGDTNYMEKPSTIPWSTINGETSYETSKQGIVSKTYPVDICISLLYPSHPQAYNEKKSQIMCAFNKFCINRQNYSLKDILTFESTDINKNSKQIYQKLDNYKNFDYFENPSKEQLKMSLNKTYSIYLIHGHSNPSGTFINSNEKLWFSANTVDQLNTPFFGADGCYVNGWWSDQKDNNKLDSSIEYTWYGSKIFTSKHVKIMALGLLSQNGYSKPVSFIENTIPGLFEGKTIAESVIGNIYSGNTIIIGDPTFHYII